MSKTKSNRRGRKTRKVDGFQKTSVAPVNEAAGFVTQAPVSTMRRGRRVISHTEAAGSLLTQSDFYLERIDDLNPSNSPFVWLATQASGYLRYRFRRLTLTYLTRSPTTSAGTVALAFLPDPDAPLPSDELGLMSITGAVTDAVWKSVRLDVPQEMLSGDYFVEKPGASMEEPRLLYPGMFLMLVSDCDTVGIMAGKLYLSYEIELWDEVSNVDRAINPRGTFFSYLLNGLNPAGSSHVVPILDSVYPKRGEGVISTGINLIRGCSSNGGTLTLPPGAYRVTARLELDIRSSSIIGYYTTDFTMSANVGAGLVSIDTAHETIPVVGTGIYIRGSTQLDGIVIVPVGSTGTISGTITVNNNGGASYDDGSSNFETYVYVQSLLC